MFPFTFTFALLFTIKIEWTEANSDDSCMNLKVFLRLKSILIWLSTEVSSFIKITLLSFHLLRFSIITLVVDLIGIIFLLWPFDLPGVTILQVYVVFRVLQG